MFDTCQSLISPEPVYVTHQLRAVLFLCNVIEDLDSFFAGTPVPKNTLETVYELARTSNPFHLMVGDFNLEQFFQQDYEVQLCRDCLLLDCPRAAFYNDCLIRLPHLGHLFLHLNLDNISLNSHNTSVVQS